MILDLFRGQAPFSAAIGCQILKYPDAISDRVPISKDELSATDLFQEYTQTVMYEFFYLLLSKLAFVNQLAPIFHEILSQISDRPGLLPDQSFGEDLLGVLT
jgi:hypothetical protein